MVKLSGKKKQKRHLLWTKLFTFGLIVFSSMMKAPQNVQEAANNYRQTLSHALREKYTLVVENHCSMLCNATSL